MNTEYTSSATLMVLGTNLDPDDISHQLKMTPDQSWIRDERNDWGGWKKYMPRDLNKEYLEEQLEFWVEMLDSVKENIPNLKSKELLCAIDIFICTDSTASIIISDSLQKQITELGLELRISFQTA